MKWRVDVDARAVDDAVSTMRRHAQSITRAFREAGQKAAQRSRREHAYRNRTRRTQDNTRSTTETVGGETFTSVQIDVPHASYLMKGGTERRHTSLTSLETAIEEMERTLDYFVEGLDV